MYSSTAYYWLMGPGFSGWVGRGRLRGSDFLGGGGSLRVGGWEPGF